MYTYMAHSESYGQNEKNQDLIPPVKTPNNQNNSDPQSLSQIIKAILAEPHVPCVFCGHLVGASSGNWVGHSIMAHDNCAWNAEEGRDN